jgi:hypothetical protein
MQAQEDRGIGRTAPNQVCCDLQGNSDAQSESAPDNFLSYFVSYFCVAKMTIS